MKDIKSIDIKLSRKSKPTTLCNITMLKYSISDAPVVGLHHVNNVIISYESGHGTFLNSFSLTMSIQQSIIPMIWTCRPLCYHDAAFFDKLWRRFLTSLETVVIHKQILKIYKVWLNGSNQISSPPPPPHPFPHKNMGVYLKGSLKK